jgi:hypothetical protein
MFRPARTGVRADVKCPEPRGIRVDGQHKLSNLLSFFQVDGSAFWAVFRIDIAQRFHGSLDVVLERVMKKKGRYRSIGTSQHANQRKTKRPRRVYDGRHRNVQAACDWRRMCVTCGLCLLRGCVGRAVPGISVGELILHRCERTSVGDKALCVVLGVR